MTLLARLRWLVAVPLVAGAGCMTWGGARPLSPGQMLEPSSGAVRVIRTDESRVVLYRPHVVGDSLVGNARESQGQRQVLPVSEVQAIQTRRLSLARTTGAVAGGVVGMMVAYAALVMAAFSAGH